MTSHMYVVKVAKSARLVSAPDFFPSIEANILLLDIIKSLPYKILLSGLFGGSLILAVLAVEFKTPYK